MSDVPITIEKPFEFLAQNDAFWVKLTGKLLPNALPVTFPNVRFHHVKNVCFPWSNSTLRHSENACSKTLQAKRLGAILGDVSANLTQNDQKGVVKRSDPEQRFRNVKKAPKHFACNTFQDVQNTISKPFEFLGQMDHFRARRPKK